MKRQPCRDCLRRPCACLTAHQAIRNALKLLPRGIVRSDLANVARLIDWRKYPNSSHADSGAVIIRIPKPLAQGVRLNAAAGKSSSDSEDIS